MSLESEKMPDRIATMFDQSTVLITGASGFLGKVLLEKILRTCIGVKIVYVLLRSKKGKSCKERLNDIINNVLFDHLKETNPHALKKCKPISGDVSLVNLGMSLEDRKMLHKNVDFIFHSAATTRFDETVATSVRINVRGTKFMLDLAKGCQKLKLFVHVSTAYSHPDEPVLGEMAYKVHPEASEVLNFFETVKDTVSDNEEILRLMGTFPNAYSFTKALAEDLVFQDMETLPAIIVRPSIVVHIKNDPLPGWYDGLQGASGLLAAAAKGLLRTMYMKGDSWANTVPVDAVINGILLSSWNYLTFDENQRFYNLTASPTNKKTWKEVIEEGKFVSTHIVPFNKVIWCPGGGGITQNKPLHIVKFYVFQIFPALLLDRILSILGHKPFLYQVQQRIYHGAKLLEYYTNRDWEFTNNRIYEILKRLNLNEKEIYSYDTEITRDYVIQFLLGSRRYIFKETDDTLPAAKRNMKIIFTIDYIFKKLFIMMVLYWFYKWAILPMIEMWS